MLAAYHNAGLPGAYKVVQENGRVDVVPTQVLGVNGSMRDLTPLMSRRVTFPLATRTVSETLQLRVDQVAHESGRKLLLLDPLFSERDKVELAATGETAADLITSIGVKFNVPLSFQCVYDTIEQSYYLNLQAVVPPNPTSGKPVSADHRLRLPAGAVTNNPFFTMH